MPIYTGVADANGDFTVPFSSNYTDGQKITVTAEKDSATKSIELYAPIGITGGGFLQYSGNLSNFPKNIGNVTISSEISGVLPDYCFNAGTIDHNIFRYATGLVIPPTITGLGQFTFVNWVRATNLSILGVITSIPFSCFDGWSKALSLTIPNSVTSVAGYAFRGWAEATSLTLPTNLVSIGDYAFLNWLKCTSLTIPNSVTTLGSNAFQGWSLATSLTLSNNLQNIPSSCFTGWVKATTLTIPNSVTTIAVNAFQNWALCAFVRIGSGVTTIAANAFQGLNGCDTIECLATTPPTIQANTFANLKATCIIKVPAASVSAYQAATNWSAFTSRIQAI